MSRRFLTYSGLFLLLISFSSPVRADIEAVQGAVMGPIQTVLQEAKAIQEDLNEIKSEIRSAVEGVSGPIKDAAKAVNDAKGEIQSGMDMANSIKADPFAAVGSKMPGFLGDLDIADQAGLQDAIKGNYLMQMPKASDIISSNKSSALSALSQAKSAVQGSVSDINSAAAGVKPAVSAATSKTSITTSGASVSPRVSTTVAPQTTVKRNISSAPVPVPLSSNAVSQIAQPVMEQSMVQEVSSPVAVKVVQPVRQPFNRNDLKASLAQSREAVSAVRAKTQAVTNTTSEMKNKLNALKSDIAQIKPAATGVSEQLQRGSDAKTEIQNKLGDLKASLAQSRETLTAAQAKTQAVTNAVSDVKNKLNADITQVKPAVTEQAASTEAKKAAKLNAKAASDAKKSGESLKSGFRQRATISTQPLSLDKGASLELNAAIKTAGYKHTETLMFGAEETAADTDLVRIKREQEEKMSALQRENFANLYAQAFTIRTNIAKENAEQADAQKKENTRDIIQATKDQALEMTKRFRKFMIMEAAIFEFKASQQTRQFSYAPEENDDE